MNNNSLEIKTPYFDKQTTNILKGIALIMMFVHHFFTFPDWWVEGISYPMLQEFATYFCWPLKLCVAVFCFITGYLYFFNKKKNYEYSFRKITDVLISYWVVFLIFAFIATTVCKYNYSVMDFFKEFFSFNRTTMIFCWYVSFYCLFMLVLPIVVKKIISKNVYWDLFFSIVIVPVAVKIICYFPVRILGDSNPIVQVLSDMVWFPTVLVGYIFARYNLFEKLEMLHKKFISSKACNIALYILAICIIPVGRYITPNIEIPLAIINRTIYVCMDCIYTPLFIYAIVNLCKCVDIKFLKKILFEIGKYSLLMWFVSCIFFNNCKEVFQPILYLPYNPILVLIWGLVLCFIPAYILSILIKKLQEIKNKNLFEEKLRNN